LPHAQAPHLNHPRPQQPLASRLDGRPEDPRSPGAGHRWQPGPAHHAAGRPGGASRAAELRELAAQAAVYARHSRAVLHATSTARLIARSEAHASCFRRRISRTRRIDTLSAGIRAPPRVQRDRRPGPNPAVEQPPTPQGCQVVPEFVCRMGSRCWPDAYSVHGSQGKSPSLLPHLPQRTPGPVLKGAVNQFDPVSASDF